MKALAILGLAVFFGTMAKAQDIRAAIGPGTYIDVGATVSRYNTDYGQSNMIGGTVYVDANLYNRIGIEAEGRRLRLNSDDGLQQSTYMVGPRFSRDFHSLRPYVKALIGRGTFEFPFGYARGSYLATGFGGGLDWRVAHTPVVVRVIDYEYQIWPDFTFGQLHPYGISAGVSLQVWRPKVRYSHK
jgi:hypothetical protein